MTWQLAALVRWLVVPSDDVPDVAPHSKPNDGDNHGTTQAQNQSQAGQIQKSMGLESPH